MGKLNKLYIRLFNSPRNFDEISFKRTKALIINTIIIGVFLWIMSIVIVVKDSSFIQTSMNTQIKNKTILPSLLITTRYTNIYSYSVNNLMIDQDFNQIDFSNYQYCMGEVPLSSSLCYNKNLYQNQNLTFFGNSFVGKQLTIDPFELTYNENYLNINFQILNKSSDYNGYLSLGWMLNIDDTVYSFTAPIKVQVVFKNEIFIDSNGVEDINIIPTVVTSLLDSSTCQSYQNSSESIDECFTNNISFFYQTNIVTTFTQESTSQLLLRILKDIFSIGKVLLSLISLILSFITTKLFFKKRTSWYENNIRDSVLYHFHYHELDDNNIINNNQNNNDQDKIELLTKEEKINSINQNNNNNNNHNHNNSKFNKLKISIKKMLRSIPNQDKYSEKLSLLSKIQYGVIVLILLSISITILVKDFNVNVLNITYQDYEKLEVPNFSFSYNSIDNTPNLWYSWDETYDNNIFNCTLVNMTSPYQCNKQYPPKDSAVPIFSNTSAYYNNTSIQLSNGDKYSISIWSILFSKNMNIDPEILDKIYIKFNLNNVQYYMKPYSNITIQLTKTVFRQPYQDIITYEPSIISSPGDVQYILVDNLFYLGNTILNIQYSTNIVKEIRMETLLEKLERLSTYILAFVSPVMTVVTFIFIKLLSKLLFKNSSTHVQFDIREAILYHLYNYKNYKSIFKKNNNNNQSQKDLYSSKNYTLN